MGHDQGSLSETEGKGSGKMAAVGFIPTNRHVPTRLLYHTTSPKEHKIEKLNLIKFLKEPMAVPRAIPPFRKVLRHGMDAVGTEKT